MEIYKTKLFIYSWKKKQDYQQQSTGLESCLPDRPLLDITRITAELNTEYRSLFGVSCLRDKEIWTRGDVGIVKLYNLKGELVKSVKTVSGDKPADIVVMLAVI